MFSRRVKMIPFVKFNVVFVIIEFCLSASVPDPLETSHGKIIFVSMVSLSLFQILEGGVVK